MKTFESEKYYSKFILFVSWIKNINSKECGGKNAGRRKNIGR